MTSQLERDRRPPITSTIHLVILNCGSCNVNSSSMTSQCLNTLPVVGRTPTRWFCRLYVITSRACSFARSSTAGTTFSWRRTTTVRTTSAVCSKSSCAICPTRCSAASSTLPSSPQQVRHVHRWPWRHSLLTSYFLIYRVLEAQAQGVHVFRFLLDAHPTIYVTLILSEFAKKIYLSAVPNTASTKNNSAIFQPNAYFSHETQMKDT